MYQACLRPVTGVANLIACPIVVRCEVTGWDNRRIGSHAGVGVGERQAKDPFVDEEGMIFVSVGHLHELPKVPQVHEIKLLELEAIGRIPYAI